MAGEMSAHHYFRDFMACDSGMIPWLLVVELVCRRGESLKDLMAERRAAYPSSGEVNFRVEDAKTVIARIEAAYAPKAEARDDTDGLSLSFGDWRFNLRASNTEPLVAPEHRGAWQARAGGRETGRDEGRDHRLTGQREEALHIQMGLHMRGQRVERRLDLRAIGLPAAATPNPASHAARNPSSRNMPCR
jgi:hypothetical protein